MISVGNRLRLLLPAVLLLLALTGCKQQPVAPVKLTGEAQGTYYAITYFDSRQRDFSAEISNLLARVDASVSVYADTSLISRINRNETDSVDKIFFDNFTVARQVSEASGGAFDCTIGRLIEAWGWGFSKRDSITPEKIAQLKAHSGYQKVFVVNRQLLKEDDSITLNFNAIAQGYTSDLIAAFLRSKEITSFLVDVGGELVAEGEKPDGSPWTIGIELPDESGSVPENLMERPLQAILSVKGGKGVATSGNYRKFYVENGVKYSHTIDPATGYPVRHSLLSATVVGPNATLADAWATAFMVVGLEKAKSFLKDHPELQSYFIYADESGRGKTWMSEGLKGMIEEVSGSR
ncbi:MAG TPA: FAD:protein FMN transferase [Bacteroidales bacterium]|nr:FAD:protein FMN transferase [Bacteroidales bacterium]HRZ48735.1 FAD:protein FMN transferase [Bacteroidales bacterium]